MIIYDDFVSKEEIEVEDDHLFLGECTGVALIPRGKNDKHICLLILGEDDGQWSVSPMHFSSYWLDDLFTQLNRAKAWMEQNAINGMNDPEVCGYLFK